MSYNQLLGNARQYRIESLNYLPAEAAWDIAVACDDRAWPNEWREIVTVFMAMHGLSGAAVDWLRRTARAPQSWMDCCRWANNIGLDPIMHGPSAPRFADMLMALRTLAFEGRAPWVAITDGVGSDKTPPGVQSWVQPQWIMEGIRNVDLRSWAIERYGPERMVSSSGFVLLDEGPTEEHGRLYSYTSGLSRGAGRESAWRYLLVRCATGRYFMLRLPDYINTVHEAQAALVGLPPEEFVFPEVRC